MARKPKLTDAIAILREMAADKNTPATARVQACKALIAHDKAAAKAAAGNADDTPADNLTRAALRLLKGGKSE